MNRRYTSIALLNIAYSESQLEDIANACKKAEIDRIFIYAQRSLIESVDDQSIDILRNNIRVLKENGMYVAVSVITLGFGTTVEQAELSDFAEATRGMVSITDLYGNTQRDAFCPEDSGIREKTCSFLKKVAQLDLDLIMIGDDICMSVRPGIGCTCDKHMKMLSEALGEEISREDLQMLVFCKGKNKYRSAWLQVMGDSLRRYAVLLRQSLDEVKPSMRMGPSLSYTNWDFEGIDAIELSEILAGNTKPFIRLSGSPYWVARGFRRFESLGMTLQSVVEFVRMQASWCRGKDIEIIDENDTWPRPRHHTSAAQVVAYDLCMLCSGGVGSLLHLVDYDTRYQLPSIYEAGYFEEYTRSLPLIRWIEENFHGKNIGVRVFETMRRVEYIDFPDEFCGQQEAMNTSFSAAAGLLANLSIPTCYSEGEVGISFGANPGRMSDEELKINLILDAPGAIEMKKRGIDVGMQDACEMSAAPEYEVFCDTMYRQSVSHGRYYDIQTAPGVKVLSWFIVGKDKYPAVYLYENSDGMRYMVMAIDGYSFREDSAMFTSFSRQEQLHHGLRWLGYSFPILSRKHAGLYILCKRMESGGLCIGLCNMSQDWLRNVDFPLDRQYQKIDSFDNVARIDGQLMYLNRDMAPYDFVAMTIT